MIERLMKSQPAAALPPIVAPAPTPRGITPDAVRSDSRANTATGPSVAPTLLATPATANPSTLADRMAALSPPPVPRAAPVSFPGSESHLVSEFVLTGCEVACKRCLSRWYVERVFSDGDVSLSCYSCRGSVTGELFPGLADDVRAAKVAAREAEGAAIVGDAAT